MEPRQALLILLLLTAWGQWAVGLLQHTASLPRGSAQRKSCNALPHCLGVVGRGIPATHCLSAWGQCAVQLLQRNASLPRGSGQRNSYNALPYCLGVVGSANFAVALPHWLGALGSECPAIHFLITGGQRALQLAMCTATPPWG